MASFTLFVSNVNPDLFWLSAALMAILFVGACAWFYPTWKKHKQPINKILPNFKFPLISLLVVVGTLVLCITSVVLAIVSPPATIFLSVVLSTFIPLEALALTFLAFIAFNSRNKSTTWKEAALIGVSLTVLSAMVLFAFISNAVSAPGISPFAVVLSSFAIAFITFAAALLLYVGISHVAKNLQKHRYKQSSWALLGANCVFTLGLSAWMLLQSTLMADSSLFAAFNDGMLIIAFIGLIGMSCALMPNAFATLKNQDTSSPIRRALKGVSIIVAIGATISLTILLGMANFGATKPAALQWLVFPASSALRSLPDFIAFSVMLPFLTGAIILFLWKRQVEHTKINTEGGKTLVGGFNDGISMETGISTHSQYGVYGSMNNVAPATLMNISNTHNDGNSDNDNPDNLFDESTTTRKKDEDEKDFSLHIKIPNEKSPALHGTAPSTIPPQTPLNDDDPDNNNKNTKEDHNTSMLDITDPTPIIDPNATPAFTGNITNTAPPKLTPIMPDVTPAKPINLNNNNNNDTNNTALKPLNDDEKKEYIDVKVKKSKRKSKKHTKENQSIIIQKGFIQNLKRLKESQCKQMLCTFILFYTHDNVDLLKVIIESIDIAKSSTYTNDAKTVLEIIAKKLARYRNRKSLLDLAQTVYKNYSEIIKNIDERIKKASDPKYDPLKKIRDFDFQSMTEENAKELTNLLIQLLTVPKNVIDDSDNNDESLVSLPESPLPLTSTKKKSSIAVYISKYELKTPHNTDDAIANVMQIFGLINIEGIDDLVNKADKIVDSTSPLNNNNNDNSRIDLDEFKNTKDIKTFLINNTLNELDDDTDENIDDNMNITEKNTNAL